MPMASALPPATPTLARGGRDFVRIASVALGLALIWALIAPGLGSPFGSAVHAQTGAGDFVTSVVEPLPDSVDGDGDQSIDTLEIALGSDVADAASKPESISIPLSCWDGVDNDLDGAADDEDPGCEASPFQTGTFPPAGPDAFESTMQLDGYELQTPLGICPLDYIGTGPVVVERTAATGGDGSARMFETEIVTIQLEGIGLLHPGSPCNPSTDLVPFPVTLIEDPEAPSAGRVTSQDPTGASDYPADSFFDVHFKVNTPVGLLTGGPPGGPIGGPVAVTNVVNSMPPYHTPANEALNPDCYQVDRAVHVHCPKPPLDHFLCYSGNFPDGGVRTVMLADQFNTSRPDVGSADRFCNAVGKNGVAIFDEGAHLERFTFVAGSGDGNVPQRVDVWNQLGSQQRLSVGQPVGLLVPSQKGFEEPPKALDHFKCYAVEGTAVGRTVSLADQFHAEGASSRASVRVPRTLCNPTTKTHAGIVTPVADPQWHLVCYAIRDADPVVRSIRVRNQFVDETVGVGTPVELCVPSMKRIVPDEIKEPPPKRHPNLRGGGKYWKVGGARDFAKEFEVSYTLQSRQPCTYDRLNFGRNNTHRLLMRGQGYAAWLDRSEGFDELTMMFMDPESGEMRSLIFNGADSLLPPPARLRRLLENNHDVVMEALETAADHKNPRALIEAFGLEGPFGIYYSEPRFRNRKRAERELRDFLFADTTADEAPAAGAAAG